MMEFDNLPFGKLPFGKFLFFTYHLGTSANVVKIKKLLLNTEIIDIRNKEVFFIDPVYELWFKTLWTATH
ncbi:MAG: hypothetical protein LBU22_14530 [Dysgonamonadaceae bacterium]|nr:hypothetical protein [Dysgonamonadaceae bacterium]